MRGEPIRTLLVRMPNWIGDAVMAAPALTAVRKLFPKAKIATLAKPAVTDLLKGHPALDEMLVYDSQGRHAGLFGKWTLARELRRHRFDLAILFQNAFEAALLTRLAQIPRRYGYATDGRGWLLTEAMAIPDRMKMEHHIHYYLGLLRPLGRLETATSPRLYLVEHEREETDRWLAEAGLLPSEPLIGLNPGSTYGNAKRWLPERFAQTADRLARTHGGRVVIVGAQGEESLAGGIAESMQIKPLLLSGRTSIRQLMAVIQRCRVFLTNDTGPMHIAAAFGVPVVAVFGPTDSRTTFPFGAGHRVVRRPVECAPCLLRECPIDHRCMTGISVDQVYQAAVEQLPVMAVPPVQTSDHGAQDSAQSSARPRRAFSPAHPEAAKTASVTMDAPFSPGPQHSPLHDDPQSAYLTLPPPAGRDAPFTQGTQHLPLLGVTVFLDRDGTLNKDTGYVRTLEEFELFPGVVESLARLCHAGARLVLITNQSGIARGFLTPDALKAIHADLCAQVQKAGGRIEAIYYCPHHPDEQCVCRKPQAGMVTRAVADLGIDLSRSYVVGDQKRDMELARKIGARRVLVTSGPSGAQVMRLMRSEGEPADYIAAGLSEAATWIVEDARERACLTVRR
ncbi:MAG: lipopolysaccharide heptosyltransferase II [Nitrospiraceae bacterium]|nr:lipopolysaccharide heptosyltransferase II [Nitrospiraceae bacterium]